MRSSGLALALACTLLLAPALRGHGGGHQPPKPEGPREPVGPPPGGTPPPVGGGGSGGSSPQPSGPSRPAPATPGPSGPATPGSSNTPATALPGGGIDPADWSVWWELNQHSFLDLRSAIWRGAVTTGDDEFFLGSGVGKLVEVSLRPNDAQLAERVLPALLRVLASERQPEVLSGCMTALAKVGASAGSEQSARCAAALVGFLANPNQQLRETAALSLGILGGAQNLRTVASLLADDDDGRMLSGRSKVAERTRAFAAYGLGVFGQRADKVDLRRYAVHQLVRALELEVGSSEIATACLNALALIELERRPPADGEDAAALPPAASREALLAHIYEYLEHSRLDRRARGHVPRALARQVRWPDDPLAQEVLGVLMQPLARPKAFPREVVHGAIAAIGTLAYAADAESENAAWRLLDRAFTQGDALGRGLALIAMAQASTRPGAPTGVVKEVRQRLLEVLAKGKSRERPWAALALGVHGHRLRAQGQTPSRDVDLALRTELENCGSPDDAGAYAIALGLRGDLASSSAVRDKLDSFRDDRARGNMALALGLMRDRDSTERLRELLSEAVYRPDLIRPLAVALALLDDESLVPALVRSMAETRSSSVRAVYAWTLANVGDARAVDPLIGLLEDPEVPDLTRGIAALGLGITCERTLQPWNTELARDSNYHAAPSSFYDPSGGGALNIR